METRSITIVAVSAVLGFLATLAVALRFWARHLKHTKFGIDDIFVFIALPLTLGVVVIDIIAASWSGVGDHMHFVPSGPRAGKPESWQVKRLSITLYSVEILHTCAMPAIKAYTLAFYMRIFVSQGFRKAAIAVSVYVFCWWLAVLLATIFQCKPVGPVTTVDAKCFDALKFLQASAVLNVVSDFVIVVMPIPAVLKLQHLSRNNKIAVIGIFMTGALVIVAGIGRTASYFDVSKDLDFAYHDYYLIIWTSIEPCMGLIGACLPSLRPLFRGMSPESLVGSIRSVLRLRSSGSNESMRRERENRSKKDAQQLHDIEGDAASGKSSNSRTRSEALAAHNDQSSGS